jgi:hypothetical protein
MAVIVVVATLRLTANSAANFQILLGTDDVMRWWFYICVPLAWLTSTRGCSRTFCRTSASTARAANSA